MPVTTEYRSWALMKRRCFNPNTHEYAQYGAVGVTVCAAWRDSFEAFLRDMGDKPSPRHTIDRIDNAKGYEPGNCRWATRTEQNRNKRNILLTANDAAMIRRLAAIGVAHKELKKRFGVSYPTIKDVVKRRTWRDDHV